MKKNQLMKNAVERIMKAHGLLSAYNNCSSFHARFTRKGYLPLVIEVIRVDGDMVDVSVAHYREMNGDLIQDPEIVFRYNRKWVSETGYSPIEITQCWPGSYRTKYRVSNNGTQVVDMRFDADVKPFANMWAKNINTQGFALKDTEVSWSAVVDGETIGQED